MLPEGQPIDELRHSITAAVVAQATRVLLMSATVLLGRTAEDAHKLIVGVRGKAVRRAIATEEPSAPDRAVWARHYRGSMRYAARFSRQ